MLSTRVKAPELTKATDWLNVSEPLSLARLKGKIVLLDFWTFCCVDCMHILPYLKELEEKYADVLVVIGVHSAKFPNEKDSSQIRRAIARYGIEHPVANDARFALWEDFWVREWPTLVLIDPDGNIVESIPCSKSPHGKMEQPIEALIAEFSESGKLDRAPVSFSTGPDSDPVKEQNSTESFLKYPGKITTDGQRLYISDTANNRIVITDLSGSVEHIVGSGEVGHADGSFADASFHSPQGLALKGNELYIADTENHLIRCVDLERGTVTIVAGTGRQSLLTHQQKRGEALSTDLSSPWDLVWLDDLLYICMAGPHQIWYYDPVKQIVDAYAGNAVESLKDGLLKDANLAQPSGITTDGARLFFADAETSAIRVAEVHKNPSEEKPRVLTLVGKGLFEFGDIDGPGEKARLQHPLGVTFADNKLYVCDSYNHKIKVIDIGTNEVRTLCGGSGPGFTDGNIPKFAEPGGLVAHGEHLFVADTNNHSIRKVEVASGKTTSVEIRAIAKLAPGRLLGDTKTLPNARHIKLPSPITVGLAQKFQVLLQVQLPQGFHLNFDAPTLVDVNSESVKKASVSFNPTTASFSLRLQASGQVGESPLQIALQLYYCGEEANAACHIASIVWETILRVIPEKGNDDPSFALNASLDLERV